MVADTIARHAAKPSEPSSAKRGYRILRFWHNEIMANLDEGEGFTAHAGGVNEMIIVKIDGPQIALFALHNLMWFAGASVVDQ